MKYIVLVSLLIFTAMLVLPVSATSPEITSWYNDKTDNDDRNILINTSEKIRFNVIANQSIDTWNWSIDNVEQDKNSNFFRTLWDTPGINEVSIIITNSNGSDTITWTITVQEEEIETDISAPEITSWYNDKTNDDDLEIVLNTNETIEFNVIANQSIDIWNWSIDNVEQDNNYDFFSTLWDTPGIKEVSVNAINSNGSNIITWTITVQEEETETDISAPEITSWYNDKTNDDDLEIVLNTNETIEFNVITDQSIDIWNWSIDNVDQDNNYDFVSTLWDTPGIKEVSVNATNSNGSDTITWTITVQEEETETDISAPEITSWNNKTNDNDLEIVLNTNETIKFIVTANQSIDIWNWSIDNVEQDKNCNFLSTLWDTTGKKEVSVNVTNSNGNDIITWSITVQEEETETEISTPEITSWNNKTNDSNLEIVLNINETIKFNVTANQSIDTWKWSIDNVEQDKNCNFVSTLWDTTGNKEVSVNVTNSNGSDTITWNVTVQEEETEIETDISAPEITSWNNKTNDGGLEIVLDISETIKFNVTADQSIDTWKWSIDNVEQDNNYNFFSSLWDTPGIKEVSVNATNSNGSDTITWNVIVKAETEKCIILFWGPKSMVDYIYVNNTITEKTKYYITTAEPMDDPKWTVDGIAVNGTKSGNTYSYTHVWDHKSIESPHMVIFTGSYDDLKVELKWYVTAYEIGNYNYNYSGERQIFGIIDSALSNHATDVYIRMEKQKMDKMGEQADGYLAQKVNELHDDIIKQQSTHEALLEEFKSGNISSENYIAAFQQAQIDVKYNQKLAQEYVRIVKHEMKNEKLSSELLNISHLEAYLTEAKDKSWDKSKLKKQTAGGN